MIAKLTTLDGRVAILDDSWRWQSADKAFEAELRVKHPAEDRPDTPGLDAAMSAAIAYRGNLEIDPTMEGYRDVPPGAKI